MDNVNIEYKEPIDPQLGEQNEVKTQQLDPALFQDLISSVETAVGNFKNYLPLFEMMQATNPKAYEAIIDIVNVVMTLASTLLQHNILQTDQKVAMDNAIAADSANIIAPVENKDDINIP